MTRPTIALTLLALIALFAATCGALQGQTVYVEGKPYFAQISQESDVRPYPLDDPAPTEGADESMEYEALTPPTEDQVDRDAAANPSNQAGEQLAHENGRLNPWLPFCNEKTPGWLPELAVPPSCLDCTCDGKRPGEPCKVWRSFNKPTHPDIDQECVVCVKEPCLTYEKAHYSVDAVVQKCFEHREPFSDHGCEDGRWFHKEGDKYVRQLHPCKTSVKLYYWKPKVEYRDVYYYIQCKKP